jgi:regulatory protein
MGYRTELVLGVVERLADLGYLDDEAFARAWVESRDRAKPRGEHALRRELGEKGVDRALVEGILGDRRDEARGAAATGDGDPAGPDDAAAERLLRRRLPALLREADPRRRRQRAYALLARNGFGPDVCATVSRRLLVEAQADPDAGVTEEP